MPELETLDPPFPSTLHDEPHPGRLRSPPGWPHLAWADPSADTTFAGPSDERLTAATYPMAAGSSILRCGESNPPRGVQVPGFECRASRSIDSNAVQAGRWMDDEADLESAIAALTPRARRTLIAAHRQSRELQMGWVGTEHLLLAMLADSYGIPRQLLASRGCAEVLFADIVDLLGSAEYRTSTTRARPAHDES
jgi:hypothetical protein